MRPELMPLLHVLSSKYNLAVWTYGGQSYAENVVNALNALAMKLKMPLYPFNANKDMVYSYKHTGVNGTKALSRLGFDMRRTILIDNNPQSFMGDIVYYRNDTLLTNGMHIEDMSRFNLLQGFYDYFKSENRIIIKALAEMSQFRDIRYYLIAQQLGVDPSMIDIV